MDPNATLIRCRRLAAQILSRAQERASSHEQTTRDTQGEELAELFQALDEWIANKQGFLPRDWDTIFQPS